MLSSLAVSERRSSARGAVSGISSRSRWNDTLVQLEEALDAGVDAVLLDNMNLDQLHQAVTLVAGKAVTEASGRITPETAPAVAATGVDLISIGWLTHSAPALDIGLDFKAERQT